jgi:hypothetical protein
MNIQFNIKLFFFLLVCCSTTSLIGQEKSISALKIGNLEWQKMNLDVSTFTNGDTIFKAKTPEEMEECLFGEKVCMVLL